MAVRAKYATSGWARQPDDQGSCPRLDEASSCASNFIVTDLVGRPVVTLDRNMKVASVGEYDPFGHVNRVQRRAESAHPYGSSAGGALSQSWNISVQPSRSDMSLAAKLHFPLVDTESCSGTGESLFIRSYPSNVLLAGNFGGYARGDVWSPWVTVPAGEALRLRFIGDKLNSSPGSCSGTQWDYLGVAMSEYEYRKQEIGASPYQPLFRGAGQYYDEETDLFENWNRYYDASSGRYLSPEPLLQVPNYLASMAAGGRSVPTYAYASNNPVRNVDSNGREVKFEIENNTYRDRADDARTRLQSCPAVNEWFMKCFGTNPFANTTTYTFSFDRDDPLTRATASTNWWTNTTQMSHAAFGLERWSGDGLAEVAATMMHELSHQLAPIRTNDVPTYFGAQPPGGECSAREAERLARCVWSKGCGACSPGCSK